MIDLTDNRIPFGLLTPEEQEHLRNWPHGVEVWQYLIGWGSVAFPSWNSTSSYRTKPAPKPASVTEVHWANDYGAFVGWYDSRENADKNSVCHTPRIAVIRREWTEGQPPKYFTEEV